MKAYEEEADAKVELDALFVSAELAKREDNATLAKVLEEQPYEAEAWKARSSWNKEILSKSREKTSFMVNTLWSKLDSATAHHHELLAFLPYC